MGSKKTSPLFPLRKGIHSRQAHVALPPGTYEEEHGRQGFYGKVSHLYRQHPPTSWTEIDGPLKPRSYNLNLFINAPVESQELSAALKASALGNQEDVFRPICFLKNHDVALHLVSPKSMSFYYRNADGDDLYFIHQGAGRLETDFGHLMYTQGDYISIPRGTTYRWMPDAEPQMYLLIESFSEINIPDRGILGPNALFDPAMIDTPEIPTYQDIPGIYQIHIKRENQITKVTYPYPPLDAVGWKGDLTVMKINVKDIRPITSHRYHLPPSVHTTFLGTHFVVCTFLPRPFEEDEDAMRVPFFHRNIDFDEVIFYSQGEFFSRDGIGAGMVTWHPTGIHHGPHPKAIPLSRKKDRTNEIAVMVDTLHYLHPTPAATAVETLNYWASWK
ncbi:MAG: homogentisate 1,2-dioxygenase [Holophagaceae bacterium]